MRHNFTTSQQREIRERSGDICEAGKFKTWKLYGMAPNDTCNMPAEEIDHIAADALVRTRIQSIDEGLHVCKIHHKIKTAQDRKKIAKAKRLDEARVGIRKPKRAWPKRRFGT
jgi:hypothetical protein